MLRIKEFRIFDVLFLRLFQRILFFCSFIYSFSKPQSYFMFNLSKWFSKAWLGLLIINLCLAMTIALMFADMPMAAIYAAFGVGVGSFALMRFLPKPIYLRSWVVGAVLSSGGCFITGLFYVNYYSVTTKLSAESVKLVNYPQDLRNHRSDDFFNIQYYDNKIDLASNHFIKSGGMRLNCVVYPIVPPNWTKNDTVVTWGAFVTRTALFDNSSPELPDRTNTTRRLIWVYKDTAQINAFDEAIKLAGEKHNLLVATDKIIVEWADINDEQQGLARKFWLAWLLLNATWGVVVFLREVEQ